MIGAPWMGRPKQAGSPIQPRFERLSCVHARKPSPPTPTTSPKKSAAVNSISIASTLAMALGLAAALPQLTQMLKERSSDGQSMLGWAMGLATNVSMAYVNLAGFGAKALMASNLLSATLCAIAMLLIVRFGDHAAEVVSGHARAPRAAASARPIGTEHRGTLIAMPTTEFAALRQVVLEVEEARERPLKRHQADDRQLALAVA